MKERPVLLFLSPQFLFPMDAGGKIRSANILKRLKGGAFRVRLSMPASAAEEARWADEIHSLADDISLWRPAACAPPFGRTSAFLSATPVSARRESSRQAAAATRGALAFAPDLVVFDYAQSFLAAPARIDAPVALFAHNVEAEILRRCAAAATGPMKLVYALEAAKMARLERNAALRANGVIAVSERDAAAFSALGARFAKAVPTGVDADYFAYAPPAKEEAPVAIFTGSLDWRANRDALGWFMDAVWPLIAEKRPEASFLAVGKNPPADLRRAAARRGLRWRFTGYVEDIRAFARGAAYVIPLRVGGGTRIKAFEAMAMGIPVVSTAIGVEGLPLRPGEHCLEANDAPSFAGAVLDLFEDSSLRLRLASAARALIERDFTQEAAARAFEAGCLAIMRGAR